MVLQWERASTYKTPDGRWTATIIIIVSTRFRSGSLSQNCHKVGHSYAGKHIFIIIITIVDCKIRLLCTVSNWNVRFLVRVPPPTPAPFQSSDYALSRRPECPSVRPVTFACTSWARGGDVGGGPSSTGLRSYILLFSQAVYGIYLL